MKKQNSGTSTSVSTEADLLKDGLAWHPRIELLAQELKVDHIYAAGAVVWVWLLAWHSARRHGDVGRFTNAEIAEDFSGDPDCFVAALTKTGWLAPHPEGRLVVTNWPLVKQKRGSFFRWMEAQ